MRGVGSLLDAEDESDLDFRSTNTRPRSWRSRNRANHRSQWIIIGLLLIGSTALGLYTYSLSNRLEKLTKILDRLSNLPDRLVEVQSSLHALRIEFDLNRDLGNMSDTSENRTKAVEYVNARLDFLANQIDLQKIRAKKTGDELGTLGTRLLDMESLCWESCKNGRFKTNKKAKSRVQKEIHSKKTEEEDEMRRRQIVFNRWPDP